jgi:Ran GTPase-activating protein (RanGAP) involved in mRNA processing and transport
MSVSNDSTVLSTVDDGRALLSSAFLEFCAKVRTSDASILPELGKPFSIRRLGEREGREGVQFADALLKNTNVTYLELRTFKYTNICAEALAKYIRTSKRLERIDWNGEVASGEDEQELRHSEEIICCILPALQETTSLKKLDINFPLYDVSTNLALENMLTHTQSLRSLRLCISPRLSTSLAAASSGLKKNTTLRELTLKFKRGAISPIFTSLREHPLLRRLCVRGCGMDLTGLETLLLSENSKITELDIDKSSEGWPMIGLTSVLQALAHRPTLTKLALRRVCLLRDEARLLCMALRIFPSLQSLVLNDGTLGSAGLTELAPALYHNTSIKVLDMSCNRYGGMDSARLLRDILRRNKTMTALDLSENKFGETTGAVECIADGLGSNSTLLKIDLSDCYLRNGDVSTLVQTLGSRNTTLHKLILGGNAGNAITSTGIGVLLEAMEQSHHITDLDLRCNYIGDGGAVLLATSLRNNALPNLTRLSLCDCGIDDDGFIALVSALQQNTSLLHLDLRNYRRFSERALLTLAESLPEIKVLQRLDLSWYASLAAAMPLLLAGLRENTSLFRFHVAGCAPYQVPPTTEEMAICAGGWMQEMERLGYRNRFLPLIRAPKERLPPRGLWPHALAGVATLPDVIFEVLHSKPNLVPSEDADGKEAAIDTGVPTKRKRG